jgi:hypothetical protein
MSASLVYGLWAGFTAREVARVVGQTMSASLVYGLWARMLSSYLTCGLPALRRASDMIKQLPCAAAPSTGSSAGSP